MACIRSGTRTRGQHTRCQGRAHGHTTQQQSSQTNSSGHAHARRHTRTANGRHHNPPRDTHTRPNTATQVSAARAVCTHTRTCGLECEVQYGNMKPACTQQANRSNDATISAATQPPHRPHMNTQMPFKCAHTHTRHAHTPACAHQCHHTTQGACTTHTISTQYPPHG